MKKVVIALKIFAWLLLFIGGVGSSDIVISFALMGLFSAQTPYSPGELLNELFAPFFIAVAFPIYILYLVSDKKVSKNRSVLDQKTLDARIGFAALVGGFIVGSFNDEVAFMVAQMLRLFPSL